MEGRAQILNDGGRVFGHNAIDAWGFGCHECGRLGVPLSSSSSLKLSSAGIVKDSDGIGLGRFAMVGLDALRSERNAQSHSNDGLRESSLGRTSDSR
jgi:hypothetical protein